MNEQEKEEIKSRATAAMQILENKLDQLLHEGESEKPEDYFDNLRNAFDKYPDMIVDIVENSGLIQGALSDIGVDKFLGYANILGFTQVLTAQGQLPRAAFPGLLTEIMKYCLLRGIQYGMDLSEYDDNIFSDYVNEL